MKQFYILLFMLLLLFGIVVVSAQAGEQSFSQNELSETHKLVAEPGELNPDAPGITLLADYGSYQLFSVTTLQLNRLGKMQNHFSIADDMDVMEINAHVVDTQSDIALMSQFSLSQMPTGSALQLIQFVGPVKDEWLAAVQAVGSEPIQYIANNGYLVWTDENGRSQLNELLNQETFLQFSAPMPPLIKLSPDLVAKIDGGEETAVIPIIIQIAQHAEPTATKKIIADLLISQSSDWQSVLKFQTIYGTIRQSDIETIAQLPDVYWLGIQQPVSLMDEIQGQILAGNIITTSAYSAIPAGPGYISWLDSYGFSQDPTDYPIVDISDDGIGNGTVSNATGDQTFRQLGLSNGSSRIAYVQTCASEGDGSGIGGHGHISLSIAGGYDARSGFPYRDSDEYQLGLGINPYGRFGGTRIFYFGYSTFPYGTTYWDISGCGDTYTGLIKKNQDSSAQISNNSWGDTITNYQTSAQAYDVGVRDADLEEPGNQELIYIFSAGNQGSSASIGNPATAKNVITVGASENYRPNGIDGCDRGPTTADDVMDIATFSSWGPAVGERAKPELVAPGSHVQGTASTHTFFNGNMVCGAEDNDRLFPATDAFFPEGQSLFTWSSGTSHSAASVAGIASLYYYWLENTYQIQTPSPAIMKAYLIAHTRYLKGWGANDTLPSYRQGYGLPDMSLGLDDTPRVFMDQQILFGESGETWMKKVMVADPSKPVRLVLAYTDAAGALGTNPQVNDINLQIETVSNTYIGNHFQNQWSITGGSLDSKNNYEAIYLPAGNVEAFNISVTAFNIAGDGVPNNGDATDQDFALICYNCVELLETIPTSQTVCMADNNALFSITAVSIPGAEEIVTYTADNLPPSTTAVFSPNPVTLPASSTLTISDLSVSTTGTYVIDIQGVSSEITRTTQVELALISQIPGTSNLTMPMDGSTISPGTVLFTWEEVVNQKTYTIDIATDNAFTNIIESATDLTETSYQATNLVMNQTYYWRVRANNECGFGDYSQVSQFFIEICDGCEDLHIEPSNQTVCLLTDDEVSYEITAVTAEGFVEEVTYSANDLPPGTSVGFNPNPVTLPISSAMTLFDLGASTAGEYMIGVQGISSVLTRTTQVSLTLDSQTPLEPLLISPADGAIGQPTSVLLNWDESTQGSIYAVEIAADSGFTNIIESKIGLTETQYQTNPLTLNTPYYWRVSSSNSCGDGDFSEPYGFTTQTNIYLPLVVKD